MEIVLGEVGFLGRRVPLVLVSSLEESLQIPNVVHCGSERVHFGHFLHPIRLGYVMAKGQETLVHL